MVVLNGTDDNSSGLMAIVLALAEVARTNQDYLLEVWNMLQTQTMPLSLAVDNDKIIN